MIRDSQHAILDILADAKAIADIPRAETPTASFPCVVGASIDDVDPKRVTLVRHGGYPVFVFPHGTRPE